MDDRLVSIGWAAEFCDVSTRTIWRWIEDGRLTALHQEGRPRSAVRLRKSEVESLFRPVTAP